MPVLDEDLTKEMPVPKLADGTKYIEKFNRLKTARAVWQSHWQEVKELVRPNGMDFNRIPVPGEKKTLKIFDATPVLSSEELAGAMQSYLASPSERWFNLTVKDVDAPMILDDWDNRRWLELISDIIYAQYSRPSVNFNITLTEVFYDLTAFGTGCMFQEWNWKTKQLIFKAFSLAEVYIDEDAAGNVDTVYRSIKWTAEDAFEIFGNKLPPSMIKAMKDNRDEEFEFIHCVQPRQGYDPSLDNDQNMRFVSAWVLIQDKMLLKESGFESMPYVTPRWSKTPGEKYGRSPAMNVLPDIKMLNSLAKIMIIASEKVIDPTMAMPDDSFIGPTRSVPGAIWYYDGSIPNMNERVFPIQTKGDLPAGRDFIQDVRGNIDRGFHIDYLRAEQKKERQNQLEIQDKRDEMLRQLAPILGRQEAELLGKTVGRSYVLLARAGLLPLAPPALHRKQLHIEYVSQASRAQSGSRANEFSRFFQDVVPVAQVDPSVMDAIDTDAAFKFLAEARDIPAHIMRSDKSIAAIRAKRAQQQQMQQGSEVANNVANAYNKVATGRAALTAAGGGAADLGAN